MQNEKISIVPFRPAHFSALPLREEDEKDFRGIDIDTLLECWADSVTYLYEGKPILIYGGSLQGGVASIHLVGSSAFGRLPLCICKEARKRVAELFAAGAHRVEAYCHEDNKRSLMWLVRMLGFRVEGLMRKSGPNAQGRFLLSLIDDDFNGGALGDR